MRPYRNRSEAGELLGAALLRYFDSSCFDAGERAADRRRPVHVLALPRGGVVVAVGVAQALDAPMDVLPVRKLGVPGSPELAMGAIATLDGTVADVIDEVLLRRLGVAAEQLAAVRAYEEGELHRRAAAYRQRRPAPALTDALPVLVDDGLATGSTMRAALAVVGRLCQARPVVAVPVAAPLSLEELADSADVVCPLAPASFTAVGAWYDSFEQVSDVEVERLLG